MPSTHFRRDPHGVADRADQLKADAQRWYATMGVSRLHRAYVSLPSHLTESERPLQERVVFFEVPGADKPHKHLEALLALAWGEDTADWCESGYIYNIHTARELFDMGGSCAVPPERIHAYDLRLLECGWGGRDGIGPEHIHYSRAADVDMFVTPRIAARLQLALSEVDRLYANEPARRAIAAFGATQ